MEEKEKLTAGEDLTQLIQTELQPEDTDMEEDAHAKNLFKYKAVLAVVLKLVVKEYADCSLEEVASYIGEISDFTEVSAGLTVKPETVRPGNSESVSGSEKRTFFDLYFDVAIPETDEKRMFILKVDLEIQKSLKITYPVENRGIYYLAREISSQLNYVYKDTDYSRLAKAYTIWICLNDIPSELQNTAIKYRMMPAEAMGVENSRDIPPCDLMEMVIIRLGRKPGDKDAGIVKYLYGVFQYQKYSRYFEEYISPKTIDSESGLRKELTGMSGIALFNYNSGRAEGMEEGRKEGRKEGMEEGRKEGSNMLSDAFVELSRGVSEKELLESGKYPEDIVKKASKLMLIVR